MEKKKTSTNNKKQGVEVFVPEHVSILYSDSAFVYANDFGLTIDFAQRVGDTKKQKVVSRIGMSKEHAEMLIAVLQKKLIDLQVSKNPE